MFFPQYLRLNVEDKTEENLDDTFDEAHEFIASALERKTSILIHCREGLSYVLPAVCSKHVNKLISALRDTFIIDADHLP